MHYVEINTKGVFRVLNGQLHPFKPKQLADGTKLYTVVILDDYEREIEVDFYDREVVVHNLTPVLAPSKILENEDGVYIATPVVADEVVSEVGNSVAAAPESGFCYWFDPRGFAELYKRTTDQLYTKYEFVGACHLSQIRRRMPEAVELKERPGANDPNFTRPPSLPPLDVPKTNELEDLEYFYVDNLSGDFDIWSKDGNGNQRFVETIRSKSLAKSKYPEIFD